ncbi:MAG: hypothetical protein HRT57_00420 [Crocinitomicaceae bacterium]|nr:hypothetical protein [Crocinitomicaceae bacterium]
MKRQAIESTVQITISSNIEPQSIDLTNGKALFEFQDLTIDNTTYSYSILAKNDIGLEAESDLNEITIT